jgi:hypothetical protein
VELVVLVTVPVVVEVVVGVVVVEVELVAAGLLIVIVPVQSGFTVYVPVKAKAEYVIEVGDALAALVGCAVILPAPLKSRYPIIVDG